MVFGLVLTLFVMMLVLISVTVAAVMVLVFVGVTVRAVMMFMFVSMAIIAMVMLMFVSMAIVAMVMLMFGTVLIGGAGRALLGAAAGGVAKDQNNNQYLLHTRPLPQPEQFRQASRPVALHRRGSGGARTKGLIGAPNEGFTIVRAPGSVQSVTKMRRAERQRSLVLLRLLAFG